MNRDICINICHLYPDLLNIYGDRGNVIALKKRCEWRGIKVNVINVTINDRFVPEDYDIIFLGGGQDYEQEIIQKDLLANKKNEIKNAITNNKVFLCICGGYQILGKYYITWDKKEIEFLGLLDLWTIGGKKRMIGNYAFECDFLKIDTFDGKVVGFENHSGRTYLGESVKPLGKIITGGGNNGEDNYEGAIFNNVYCSYSHGSLLPKNPMLADHLIKLALAEKYPHIDMKNHLTQLDDSIELTARAAML